MSINIDKHNTNLPWTVGNLVCDINLNIIIFLCAWKHIITWCCCCILLLFRLFEYSSGKEEYFKNGKVIIQKSNKLKPHGTPHGWRDHVHRNCVCVGSHLERQLLCSFFSKPFTMCHIFSYNVSSNSYQGTIYHPEKSFNDRHRHNLIFVNWILKCQG